MLLTADLQDALDRCMQAHPPSGWERRLHPDASRMANLWSELILSRAIATPLRDVKHEIVQAWTRWRGRASIAPD